MNNSSHSNQCPATGLSVAAYWLQTIVYLAVLLVALLGNMVIVVVFTNRNMRSPTNYLIVNIAAGDLLMVVFAMLPTAVSMLLNTHKWIDGIVGVVSCKLFVFTANLSISCSIFAMTALAFERFAAVKLPLKQLVSMSSTKRLNVVLWLALVLSNAPLLYATKVVVYRGLPYCTEEWSPAFHPVLAPAVFTAVSFALQYALPLLIISTLYFIIIRKVWFRTIPGNATPANVRLNKRYKKNVLKMLIATVVAFAVCWLLNHITFLLIYFGHPCGISWELQLCGFLLGHANTAINCCIYVLFCADYRSGFTKILIFFVPCCSHSIPQDQMQNVSEKPRGQVKSPHSVPSA